MTPPPKPKNRTKTSRAGLTFPVGRIHKILKKGNYAPRVGNGSAIYLTATLEYLAAEILELASDAAQKSNKSRISPRHILIAVRNDDELNRMMDGAVISQAGVLPAIHPMLLPKKTAKNTTAQSED